MSFIVREEDGTSKLVLEDASGSLLLEEAGPVAAILLRPAIVI